MKQIVKILICIATMSFVRCSDDTIENAIKGIGSIEMNDTLIAIHYYDNTYIISNEYRTSLTDSARVQFKISATQRVTDTAYIYKANVIELTSDIRTPIVRRTENLTTDTAICIPTDLHITRDFRHLDFFNISTRYTTCSNNDDKITLVFCADEQEASTDSLVVLWLRHSQSRSDTLTHIEYNTISVPLNELIPSDSVQKERLYIKLKMLGDKNDTVVTNYVYSFVNIIE